MIGGEERTAMTLQVTSTAFAQGALIPAHYTCDGANASPPLRFDGIPAGTKSLALLCEDPDAPAGLWVHWVLYNLPPASAGLPEAMPDGEVLPSGAHQGLNNARHHRYDGPCPPDGTHRYYFKLYALDTTLAPETHLDRGKLLQAMDGHILARGELMGRYSRQ